jgi:hypothetical protein
MWRAVLAMLVIVWSSTSYGTSPESRRSAAVTQATSSPPVFALARGEMARVLTAYQELPRRVDRSTFDVKARAASLGSDPAMAFAFVRDRIRNEIYPGVLRGPSGTLQAQAGNDLDKTLLLAALLREGKQSVRFAHCTLEPALAQRHITAAFGGPPPVRPIEPDLSSALRAAFVRNGMSVARSNELVDARRSARAWFEGAISETARSDLALVRDALGRAGIKPIQTPPDPRIIEDGRAHYWAQLNRAGGWQDLDASIPNGTGAAPCAPVDTYAELPPELFQTMTIAVRNEYIDGATLRAETPLRHQFRVSDLYGKTIRFVNVGSIASGNLLQSGKIETFTPYLSSADEVISGTQFNASSSASAAASIMDAFGAGDDPPALAAQWLDFVFQAPGRRSAASRAIVDLVDPAERARRAVSKRPDPTIVAVALAQGCAIAVSAGLIDQAAAIETAYINLDAQAAGRSFDEIPSPSPTDQSPVNDQGLIEEDLLAATALAYAAHSERALSALGSAAGPHVRLIRDQPLLAIVGILVRPKTDGTMIAEFSVDLRHDRVRVMTESPAFAEDGFWTNALRGLLDGAVEHHAPVWTAQSAGTASSSGPQFDTSLAFQIARARGVQIKAAAGADVESLLLDRLADAGGRRMISEISNEMAIVVPAVPLDIDGERRSALWALNLRTGELVSMIDTALHGQDTTEQKLTRLVNFLENQIRRCVSLGKNPARCRQMFQMWKQAADDLRQAKKLSRVFGTRVSPQSFGVFSY